MTGVSPPKEAITDGGGTMKKNTHKRKIRKNNFKRGRLTDWRIEGSKDESRLRTVRGTIRLSAISISEKSIDGEGQN